MSGGQVRIRELDKASNSRSQRNKATG